MKKTIISEITNSDQSKSDEEPTIEQLNQIMREVAIDARQKAHEAKARFQEQLTELCIAGRKQ